MFWRNIDIIKNKINKVFKLQNIINSAQQPIQITNTQDEGIRKSINSSYVGRIYLTVNSYSI